MVKRHAFLKVQAFAREHFFGDRQQGGVFDLKVLRNHTHLGILPALREICNWSRLWQFDCATKSGTTIAGKRPPNPHEHCLGLDKGFIIVFLPGGTQERILLAHQNFFWVELCLDS